MKMSETAGLFGEFGKIGFFGNFHGNMFHTGSAVIPLVEKPF